MKAKLRRLRTVAHAITDRLPGGERRKVLRGRTNPDGLSPAQAQAQAHAARLQAQAHADHQAGIAGAGHIGTTGGTGSG